MLILPLLYILRTQTMNRWHMILNGLNTYTAEKLECKIMIVVNVCIIILNLFDKKIIQDIQIATSWYLNCFNQTWVGNR